MITYDVNTRCFILGGKTYDYFVYVDAAGILQQLYYGKKIERGDIAFLIREHGSRAEPNPADPNREMTSGNTPSEIGSFGRGDYRQATVIARRSDGAAMSAFRYVSHKIVRGATKPDGLPGVRVADETLIVTVKDECSGLTIDLYYIVADDSDVLTRYLVVRNDGDDAVTLERAYSFCLDLPDTGEFYATRLAGDWASERTPVTTPVADGTIRIESTRGYSSHQMNPFLMLRTADCTETSGECYCFALLYSGSFALAAERGSSRRVRVQGGVNDYGFLWKLAPGEEFTAPEVAMCYSAAGAGQATREYHDFFRDRVINPAFAKKPRPIVLNNWEATYFDVTEEKLFAIIDEAASLGADTFVLDDGWFGRRNADNCSLGDWYVNSEKFPAGLKGIIDKCKSAGLKFGLWLEPEMVSEDSDLYRSHPDFAIAKRGVEPCRSRNQLVLDLTKSEVVDYLFGVISRLLTRNDISYIKWDKNRDMTEFYSDGLPFDRQGEFQHRYTLGFYDLADRLTRAFPNVLIEGCAGGGGRFDGGALYYFPQIWTSDCTDCYDRARIQYGTSFCYPLSSASCHVSACPNHQTGRVTPLRTRGAIASLGATGYELDPGALASDEKERVKQQIRDYRKIEDLVLMGDFYRLIDPFACERFAVSIVSKDKTCAYVVGECFRAEPCGHDRIIKLRGLCDDYEYFIEELGLTASGKALTSAGLTVPRLIDCDCWIWHLRKVSNA